MIIRFDLFNSPLSSFYKALKDDLMQKHDIFITSKHLTNTFKVIMHKTDQKQKAQNDSLPQKGNESSLLKKELLIQHSIY